MTNRNNHASRPIMLCMALMLCGVGLYAMMHAEAARPGSVLPQEPIDRPTATAWVVNIPEETTQPTIIEALSPAAPTWFGPRVSKESHATPRPVQGPSIERVIARTTLGAPKEGQVLMFRNGRIAWTTFDALHSAAPDLPYQMEPGSGRRPTTVRSGGGTSTTSSNEERRIGGGGSVRTSDSGGGNSGGSSGNGISQADADARYVNVPGDTMTGPLRIEYDGLGLLATGGVSGALLHAEQTLSSSGSLVWEGAASGATLYIATSFNGAGLVDCDAAGSQKLLWDSTTGRFSCGTDQTVGVGLDLNTGDERYVNVSGDTMTGALAINVLGGDGNAIGLRITNTASGRHLHGEQVLSSSGTLIAEGLTTLNGDVTIGDATSDVLIVTARLGSDFLPATDGAYDVGSPSLRFGSGYFATGLKVGNSIYVLTSSIEGTDGINLVARNATNLTFTTNGAERARIDSTGRFGIGVTDASTALEVLGTASGTDLYATRSITGSHLYVATTFAGAGLGDCDTASTSKLLWDATTKRFSCGTDQNTTAWSNTGSLQTAFDARYVNTSGDTMTGALLVQGTISGRTLIVSGNASVSGALVSVGNITTRGTLSGSKLFVATTASVSGSLVIENSLTGATFYGFGLTNCSNATSSKLLYDAATGKFSCGTDQTGGAGSNWSNTGSLQTAFDARYVNTSGDTMTGALTINLSSGYLGLRILQTASGNYLHAEKGLSSSGTLVVVGSTLLKSHLDVSGTISGAALEVLGTASGTDLYATRSITGTHLYIATTFAGAGLGDCDTASTSKLLWDATTKRFSCGTDQTGGAGSHWSNTGSLQTAFDARYMNTSGDTMTGALTINLSSGYLGLRILQTASGNYLHAEKGLSSSGTLVVVGSTLLKSHLDVSGTISGAALEVLGTASGTDLYATRSITGSHLYVATTFAGAGLGDCDTASTSKLLWDATTKRFSCGTDQNTTAWSNTGSLQTAFDARYVNTSGDTMTGALLVQGTISGRTLIVSGNASISGALVSVGNITTRGTLSGSKLFVATTASISGSLAIENSLTGATFYGFGLTNCNNATSSKLLYDAATGKFSCATDQTGGAGSHWSNTGSLQTAFDARYVNTSGDTMTGALTINVSDGSQSTIGLKVLNTFSGAQVHAEKLLTTSGSLVAESDAYIDGTTFVVKSGTNRVGIGTESPTEMLEIYNASLYAAASIHSDAGASYLNIDSQISDQAGLILREGGSQRWTILNDGGDNDNLEFATNATSNVKVLFTQAGDVGIGTLSPKAKLDVLGAISGSRLIISGKGSFSGALVVASATGKTLVVDSGMTEATANVFEIYSDYSSTNNKILRVQGNGAVYADGAYNSTGADYAEWFYDSGAASAPLRPGELVCIDPLRDNAVRRCERSADPNLMGIVSTNPAFIGNQISGADGIMPPGYALVGLIGQVPASVSTENGPIRPGDALTASSIPGVARRASAGESTVGVALEGYDGAAIGNVNVLISRRNQSLTVEVVEERILESIAAMGIEDRIAQSLQSSLNAFNLSDKVRSTLDDELKKLDLDGQIRHVIASEVATGSLVSGDDFRGLAGRVDALTGSSAVLSARLQTQNDVLQDLEGRIHVLQSFLSGGTLTMSTIRTHDLQTQTLHTASLTVTGAVRMSGPTTIGSMSIDGTRVRIGSLTATGALEVVGPVTIQGLATFLGDVKIAGQLVLSSKQAGFAVIPATGSSVTIIYDVPLIATGAVHVTPQSRVGAEWWVERSTATGFVLQTDRLLEHDARFTWTALAVDHPRLVIGTGSLHAAAGIPFYVNLRGQPLSSNSVWNACIQGRIVLVDGDALSCSRYHDGYVWEHPDHLISFTYNPNNEPPILRIPDGYVLTMIDDGSGKGDVSDGASGGETSSGSSGDSSGNASSGDASGDSSGDDASGDASSGGSSDDGSSGEASGDSSDGDSSDGSSDSDASDGGSTDDGSSGDSFSGDSTGGESTDGGSSGGDSTGGSSGDFSGGGSTDGGSSDGGEATDGGSNEGSAS